MITEVYSCSIFFYNTLLSYIAFWIVLSAAFNTQESHVFTCIMLNFRLSSVHLSFTIVLC